MPEGVTDPNYKPLPGRLGNLTVAQLHALDTLRKQLQDEGHFVPERMHDAALLRCVFSCARKRIAVAARDDAHTRGRACATDFCGPESST